MALIQELAQEHYSDGVVLTEFDLANLSLNVPFKSSFFTVPPESTSDEDVHDVLEIWVVASGELTVHLNEDRHDLTTGQAIIFAPQHVHRAQNKTKNAAAVVSLWWSGTPQ